MSDLETTRILAILEKLADTGEVTIRKVRPEITRPLMSNDETGVTTMEVVEAEKPPKPHHKMVIETTPTGRSFVNAAYWGVDLWDCLATAGNALDLPLENS